MNNVSERNLFDEYVKKRIGYNWISNPFQYDRLMILKKFLSKHKGFVLDCGCGEKEPLVIADYEESVALDITKKGLQNLGKNLYQGQLIQASCYALPFAANSFDRVVCSEVIEHLPQEEMIQNTIKELARVSHSFLITTANSRYRYKMMDPTHRHFFNKKSIRKFLPQSALVSTSNLCATVLPHFVLKIRYFAWLDARLQGLRWRRFPQIDLSWLFKFYRLKRKLIDGAFVIATYRKS